ncbi:MAG: hypothetical protein EXR67_03020 [Dehalococcoidia bacterium]|nr:hypothetical protein [Dehalococcoidia bacterium]
MVRWFSRPKAQHIADEALSCAVDGVLTSAESLHVKAHLSACAECAQRLDSLRQAVMVIRQTPQMQPLRPFSMPRVAEPARQPAFTLRFTVAAAAASFVALTAVIGADWVSSNRTAPGTGPVLPAANAEPHPTVIIGSKPVEPLSATTSATRPQPESPTTPANVQTPFTPTAMPSAVETPAAAAFALEWWPLELALAAFFAVITGVAFGLWRRPIR